MSGSLPCPKCKHTKSDVLDTRNVQRNRGRVVQTYRRRVCRGCGERFSTYEMVSTGLYGFSREDNRRRALITELNAGVEAQTKALAILRDPLYNPETLYNPKDFTS